MTLRVVCRPSMRAPRGASSCAHLATPQCQALTWRQSPCRPDAVCDALTATGVLQLVSQGSLSMSFTASRLGSLSLGAAPPQHRSTLSAPAARRRPAHGTRLLVRALANTFGTAFRVTTFGESHGGGVGCVVDGVPPRMHLSTPELQARGRQARAWVAAACRNGFHTVWWCRTLRAWPPGGVSGLTSLLSSVRAGPPAPGAEPHHNATQRGGHVRDPLRRVGKASSGAHGTRVCSLSPSPLRRPDAGRPNAGDAHCGAGAEQGPAEWGLQRDVGA